MKMSTKQIILLVVLFLAAIVVVELPFNYKIARQMNVFSAYLCELMMYGLGAPVVRYENQIQTLITTPPIKFYFLDGYWMLKQLYMLLPLSLLLSFIYRKRFKKLCTIGMITLLIGFCLRALMLGANAVCFGQQTAAGWMDTVVRIFVILVTFMMVHLVAAKKEGEGSRNCRYCGGEAGSSGSTGASTAFAARKQSACRRAAGRRKPREATGTAGTDGTAGTGA